MAGSSLEPSGRLKVVVRFYDELFTSIDGFDKLHKLILRLIDSSCLSDYARYLTDLC
jgi:hypothetical protein